MKFNVIISSDVNEENWNNELSKNINSTIYQTYVWQKLYQKSFDSKPVFITVTNENDDVVGQLACLIHHKMLWGDANSFAKKIGNSFKLGKSLWWYHGPIIHDDSHTDEIIRLLLSTVDEIAKQNNVVSIRCITPPLIENFPSEPFKEFGYQGEPKLTFVIDLTQNLDDLYKSLKKDTRYYIRKSEKEDYEFDLATEKTDMARFQDLKSETKRKEGKKHFLSSHFWENHWDFLNQNGFEKLVVGRKNGKIEGTILTLFFNGNSIQHALSNNPDGYLIGTFLTWNTLKWVQKMNFRTFDFAGVDPIPKTNKEKGIYFYAEKFGGKKFHYFSYTKILDNKKYLLSTGLKTPKKIFSKINLTKNKNTIKMSK